MRRDQQIHRGGGGGKIATRPTWRAAALWALLYVAGCAGNPAGDAGPLPEDYREIAISAATLRHVLGGFRADMWEISAPFQTTTPSHALSSDRAETLAAWAVCLRRLGAHGAILDADLVTYRGGDIFRYATDAASCRAQAHAYGPLVGPDEKPPPGPQSQIE